MRLTTSTIDLQTREAVVMQLISLGCVVAPLALRVHRHEIHAQIRALNRTADPGQRSAVEARLKGRLP